jgi:hypothetical protein
MHGRLAAEGQRQRRSVERAGGPRVPVDDLDKLDALPDDVS